MGTRHLVALTAIVHSHHASTWAVACEFVALRPPNQYLEPPTCTRHICRNYSRKFNHRMGLLSHISVYDSKIHRNFVRSIHLAHPKTPTSLALLTPSTISRAANPSCPYYHRTYISLVNPSH
uniref:Uncharacterized protein n=1 Tax=Schistocephalus solidus TaxID=70667 RepID=A0A0X3PEC5_SCHSO